MIGLGLGLLFCDLHSPHLTDMNTRNPIMNITTKNDSVARIGLAKVSLTHLPKLPKVESTNDVVAFKIFSRNL